MNAKECWRLYAALSDWSNIVVARYGLDERYCDLHEAHNLALEEMTEDVVFDTEN